MRTPLSAPGAIRAAFLLAVLCLGCGRRSFTGFADFQGAPAQARHAELRAGLKEAKIPKDSWIESRLDQLLTQPELTPILDRALPSGGFASRFDPVVALAFRTFQPLDGQDLKERVGWFLEQFGVEATEPFLDACERLGGQVALPRAVVAEFKQAQAEEKRRRFQALWGPYAAWSTRPEHAQARQDIRTLFQGEAELGQLRKELAREKAGNDRRVRHPYVVQDALYPQVSGVFSFVKILDRSTSEALFSASDGLFVLRLSEGYSFQAYPGQGIRMTIHNRGEKMSMNNGSRLPVFITGPSPTQPRNLPGYEPDRSEEARLAQRVADADGALNHVRQALREEAPGRLILDEANPVQLVFERKGSAWQGVIIRDRERGLDMYASSLKGGKAPANGEDVPLKAMLANP